MKFFFWQLNLLHASLLSRTGTQLNPYVAHSNKIAVELTFTSELVL